MSDDLIVAETLRPEIVFAPGGVDALLEKLERDVRAVATDISTKAGRAAISSLAHKVSRSKTALDDLGRGLVADWKLRSALVDAERRRIRERLDELRDEVRRPLTEWEDAEKRRVDEHENALAMLENMRLFTEAEPSVEEINRRISLLEHEKTPRQWHEFAKRAGDIRGAVLHSLEASRETAIRRDAERAELARLRKEALEREQRERDDRLRTEAAEKARAAAEAEAREAARVQAAREAAERARMDRERVAAEEARRAEEAATTQARKDAEAAKWAAEELVKDMREQAKRDADAAVEEERRRVSYEKQREDEAVRKREADERHRMVVHAEIVKSLRSVGLSAGNAAIVLDLLVNIGVPHVRVTY